MREKTNLSLLLLALMLMTGITTMAQITPSTDNTLYLYRIQSRQKTSYYVGPNTSYIPYLKAYNSDNEGDEFYWYFEAANISSDTDYYYIVNYETGQYLLCNDPNGGANTIALSDSTPSVSPSMFCFRLVQYTNPERYAIMPRGSSYSWNPYGNFTGNIGLWTASHTNSHWSFTDETTVCRPPSITFANGTVTMTGNNIYYTTDGSTPTTSSSAYSSPISTDDISLDATSINAISYCSTLSQSSKVVSFTITRLPIPTITVTDNTIFVSSDEAEHIYYAVDGTASNTSTEYTSSGISFSNSNSSISLYLTASDYFPIRYNIPLISSVSDLNNMTSSGLYILTDDIDDASSFTTISSFSGTLDGGFHTIKGLTNPLFATVDGATIRNVILDDVTISSGTNVGAIANEAEGATRIYNCGVLSGSISGSDDVGSIVGQISGTTNNVRVINCYSFATITGGSYVAGIVGRNESTATTTDNIGSSSMIMNCMFYGDITATGATNVSPIYGGNVISNAGSTGINTYNYYLSSASLGTITDYNCSQTIDERYLNRFEFYRYMLNSNRELCAYYVSGSVDDTALIAKWVLDQSEASAPILKKWGKYTSVINPDYANASEDANAWEGKKLGTLSVTINAGTHGSGSRTETFVITDIDSNNYDFNYYKIQLPYYNDYWDDNYTDYVVTGWKITSISGGTSGNFTTTGTDAYNFADRYCTNKDLYEVTGRVFAQGGFFNVPEGVTAITIEAYWGNAIYVSDITYDVTYKSDFSATTNFASAGNRPTSYNGHTVYTITNALGQLQNVGTVYDQALVLVGNVHLYCGQNSRLSTSNKYPYTVMSIDRDHDNEPDHSFLYQHTNRQDINPVRFDFINFPGIGMVAKVEGSVRMPNQGIFRPFGWFEITETCVVRFTEFEYEYSSKVVSPLIFNGGIVEQIVSAQAQGISNNTSYIQLGGRTWFKAFTPGCHADQSFSTKHAPLNILGGEYEEVYLTGMFKPNAGVYDDNGQMYTNGGKIGHFAGGGQEQLKNDVIVKADHTLFHEFYGGGVNAAKPVLGKIDITINNSIVGIYAGGPKFGSMETDKTVTTNATGTIFDTYYGAGIGGTSLYRDRKENQVTNSNYNFNTWCNNHYSVGGSTSNGYAIGYDCELFAYAGFGDNNNVGRFYVHYGQLSKSITNAVTSTLTNCVVNNNYYGAGFVGVSNGLVTSTLNNTEVMGSVFGGGNSSSVPECDVYPQMTADHNPTYNTNTGAYTYPDLPTPTQYQWVQGNSNSFDQTNHIIYTTTDLSDMGMAKQGTILTINGGHVHQNVFGGGNESAVDDGSSAEGTVVTIDGAQVDGNVFGGGNQAAIDGNTNVIIKGASIIGTFVDGVCTEGGNVYGGGNMGEVDGNTNVTIGECE